MINREAIVTAIKLGDINTLREYITQADKTLINEQDKEGDTLLHVAVKYLCQSHHLTENIPDNIADVILLLAKHVNRRVRNGDKKLAVHYLLGCEATTFDGDCYIPVLDALLTEEYIDEECDVEGRHILHDAAQFKKWDIVRLLVNKGIRVTVVDGCGNHALFYVTYERDVPDDIVQMLSHPDVINELDRCGYTPLMRAASVGNSEMVEQLIRTGADNTVIGGNSNTALILAVSYNGKLSVEALKALIHPSIVNHKDKNSETALHFAASHWNVAAIEVLINAGADINVKCHNGQNQSTFIAVTDNSLKQQ